MHVIGLESKSSLYGAKTMKTITETKTIDGWDFGNLESLIDRLSSIRASTNEEIQVTMAGSLNYGYQLRLSWQRPMTQEEEDKEIMYKAKAENAAKEIRRREYEKLKAEFE